MKPSYLLTACALILVVLGIQYKFFSPEIPLPPEACYGHKISEIDYSVYRTLLPIKEASLTGVPGATILVTETIDISDRKYDPRSLPDEISNLERPIQLSLSQSTISNFINDWSVVSKLDDAKFKDMPIVLSSSAEIDEVFSKGIEGTESLGRFNLIRFSRIGFNCERDQALVYRALSCGGLCGSGDLMVLKKKGIEWIEVFRSTLWIS